MISVSLPPGLMSEALSPHFAMFDGTCIHNFKHEALCGHILQFSALFCGAFSQWMLRQPASYIERQKVDAGPTVVPCFHPDALIMTTGIWKTSVPCASRTQ